MDATEQLVADFLAHRGYTDIRYEPDGNIPPDFLVDGHIAVEARRLNQNYNTGARFLGLEEAAIPLWQKMKKLAMSFGRPTREESWHVFYHFQRPIEAWSKLEPKLHAALANFVANATHARTTLHINKKLRLEIARAGNLHQTFFVMGGYMDRESGGWLLSELESNLKICIAEKTEKIAKVRSKYREWWLVLADHIGYGLDEFDQALFKDQTSILHDWDKVILVDPSNCARAFEL